jgi:SAM-dependent methyltransferase
MDPAAMAPHGRALLAYAEGDAAAAQVVRRDDGHEASLPVALFFRTPDQFWPIERTALARCDGHVLDIGAGSGLHTLALQARGLPVTAIDISPEAVAVMRRRGVRDARASDIYGFTEGRFDTLLMLGHGIGITETLAGLDRFLLHAGRLTAVGGRLLVTSLDVRRSDVPKDVAYREANRRAGRYVGEIRMQVEFAGQAGPYCGWLHVDAETLTQHAVTAGWTCEIEHQEESGDYLASLTKEEIP